MAAGNHADVRGLGRIAGECPESATLHKSMGQFCARSGDLANGIAELETAIRLDSGNAKARAALDILNRRKKGDLNSWRAP